MSSAAELLVVILAVVLSIFLIVAIILIIYLLRLSAEIRRVAKTAQSAASLVENVMASVSRLTSPLFIAQLFGQGMKKFTKLSRRKK